MTVTTFQKRTNTRAIKNTGGGVSSSHSHNVSPSSFSRVSFGPLRDTRGGEDSVRLFAAGRRADHLSQRPHQVCQITPNFTICLLLVQKNHWFA